MFPAGIQFMTNTEVTNIDFKKKQLSLANQPPVEYGKLLLCTGSTVSNPHILFTAALVMLLVPLS